MASLALSPPLERQRLWFAHVAIIICAEFSAEAARGLILPTLFSYSQRLGGDLVFMGLLTALFSAGRFASSLVLGFLSDRVSFKTLYYLSAVIAIAGNVLYVLPYSRHLHSKSLLAASRFVVGVGAGNRSVCRANIAALTRVDQRVSYFTLLATVVFVAYALTPGLGGIFGDGDFLIGGSEYFHFNQFTAPGFVLVGLNLLTIAATSVVYDESVAREDAPRHEMTNTEKSKRSVSSTASPDHVVWIGIPVFIFLNCVARGILSIFETVNVPLYLKVFHHTKSVAVRVFDPEVNHLPEHLLSLDPAASLQSPTADASQFFVAIGLLGLVAYGAVHVLGGEHGRVSDVSFLLVGFAVLFAGNACLFVLSTMFSTGPRDHKSMEMTLFIVAESFVWSIGCPIVSAVIVSAFSKVLGTRPQGKLMGLFGASGSIARMVLPFLPGVLPSWELLFLATMALCLSSVVVLVVYFDRLRPT